MKKTDIEQARANALKTVRAAVRLKHSIAADEELNQVLPQVEKRFDRAVQGGVLPAALDIKKSFGL